MKTIKILAIIFTVLAATFLALHFIFSPKTEPVSFEYRDMPYNLITWRISDSDGNNPVMNYCLLEEADDESLTFTLLQDYGETAWPMALEISLKLNLKEGMLESLDMQSLLDDPDMTTNIQWNADFSMNRLTRTYYVNNNRDGREIPRFNIMAIREKPTWMYSNVYLADMVLLLPYLNTGAATFSASLVNGNNYTKLIFKRAADSSGSISITYKFTPYGIFGVFSSLGGEFTLINNGSFIELKQLSTTGQGIICSSPRCGIPLFCRQCLSARNSSFWPLRLLTENILGSFLVLL